MKPALALILLSGLAACSGPEQPVEHVFRYPATAAVAATGYQPGIRYDGMAQIVDYRNHALNEPEEGQRWLLVSGAFLLTRADGTILQTVPATYRGR
ncbi:RcnB family protein [Paracoccus laeviglucosivorans]|uniref:Nickel/cobalt transporter regulator n=1 Tax=Paracoccus laeviglucosivorans TaxID=1197861 RepID=A0A521FA30_9RHOB|nr:RcnB family protein [Paracoccus laeviglucosivorans]SMO93016.1 Nickel/cobalt transporter regulator [Paracoccus laeviglucosivorans]